jgi:3'-phosphoadenosine 5'-phosphosulfate sulfotransferase (PAPS reductase)/FAD synthetase
MTYEQKLVLAKLTIKAGLENSRNPAVMCSFGKDSMVVLHLVNTFKRLKVIFHREPFQHHKYDYANRVMKEWDLHVIDYPPSSTAAAEVGSDMEVVNYYQIGARTVHLPTGLKHEDKGPDTLCALTEIYGKPTGTFNYPFDLVFHGHKSVDSDPIMGDVPLFSDVAMNIGAPSAAFPIRHFTHADVWRYIEENNIPIHHDRYEKRDGEWVEKDDKTNNPDYIGCCYACMSQNTGNSVHCPKWGLTVSNVSSQLRWAPKLEASYLKR